MIIGLSPTLLCALLWSITGPGRAQAARFAECSLDDFSFHYTECDERGERWRYALPKNHRLHCINTPTPVSGLNCCRFGSHGELTMKRVVGEQSEKIFQRSHAQRGLISTWSGRSAACVQQVWKEISQPTVPMKLPFRVFRHFRLGRRSSL
jgi:hypothetical protein